jgi:FkbH-like protein
MKNAKGMVLSENDFVDWRINWDDKAKNVYDITNALNIGLQSVVFIDDNEFERARVKDALPEVLVPDWPSVHEYYVAALHELDCFDTSPTTEEDTLRTQMYIKERERAKLRSNSESIDDWLNTIGTKIEFETLNDDNLLRVVQLLNKSNQMNLTTRRTTSEEFVLWNTAPENVTHVVKVSDRFGDAGLTGIIGMHIELDCIKIVDFVLSCRVMCRLVEEAMVSHVIEFARSVGGMTKVVAEYVPTNRNKPCLEFWQQRSRFKQFDNVFVYDLHEVKR